MINLYELIASWANKPVKNSNLVKELFNSSSSCKRFAFGRNIESIELSNTIEIDGYIDDFTKETTYRDKPIISLEDALSDENAIIINCVLNSKPRTAYNRLLSAGAKRLLNYGDICKFNSSLKLPDFVISSRDDYLTNFTKWQNVYNNLIDDESKKTFNDILSFRLTGDFSYLNEYDFRVTDQYFEDFMNYENEVFVDAGGFDGDTTEEFCNRYPDYKKVFLIEPSNDNMIAAKERLKNFHSINYIEKGVSDKSEQLRFSSEAGSSSNFNDEGDVVINVGPIDELINEPVTFIKMDLEGWELKALEGTRKHIKEDHPKLAIAVYHNPFDFWQLYEFVLSIRSDYDIHLRHYTESWVETVMFFLPKK